VEFPRTARRVVGKNRFHRIYVSAILVENDVRGWFESGPVRDMTIRGNRFINCREPVININPRNLPNPAVHRTIRIVGNEFVLRGGTSVRAKSITNLLISGNTIYSDRVRAAHQAIRTNDCSEIRIEKNEYRPLSAGS
jgi:hypothetical protein